MAQDVPPTPADHRAEFDAAIAAETNPAAISRLELAREYFTNAEFRRALSDYLWSLTTGSPLPR